MKIISSLNDLSSISGPLHLALGVFDGVHIGHQAVIASVVQAAKADQGVAGVLTFDPHPIRVLAPQVAPQRILASLTHKKELLAELGVELMVVIPFTVDFATVPAEEFLNELQQSCQNLRTLAMGQDWKFGHQRGGDVDLLQRFGEQHSIDVEAMGAVMLDGERVSSTRIRQALRDGNLSAAAAMLGREYTVLGTVVEGRKLGRQLGFPTANLRAHNEQLPSDGVWAVDVTLESGAVHRGAGNLGVRPTVEHGEARRMLEIHLLDFSGDLYGQDVEVRFVRHVRPEMKFGSLDELQEQIQKDVQICRDACND
ncbi:bifunctional riboflavin kinase/FAD synthetase [Verrucomicrobiaceae bacterium R5-34]|nr:bifunctional riboflavin kinase/FAD synthetase [Verrucomicrobiaceae bacterium R5-34]